MHAPKQSKPIFVTTVGMDQRMCNTLQHFFQNQCNNLCVLVGEESAEVGILDLDSYDGSRLADEYRKRHTDQPVILLSLNETVTKEAFFLRKPLKAKELLAVLGVIKQRLSSAKKASLIEKSFTHEGELPSNQAKVLAQSGEGQSVNNATTINDGNPPPSTFGVAMLLEEKNCKALIGTRKDIDPSDAKQLAIIQYDPQDFLLGHLQRALKHADTQNTCVKLITPSGLIIIYPKTQQVITTISTSRLRTLSSVPIDADILSLAVIEEKDIQTLGNTRVTNRMSLLWQVALWASRGRVPKDTDLSASIFLLQWPNMTRLLLFPYAMQITALWIKEPRSLIDTASTLAIPQRYVFALFSAAYAVGLADVGRRNADTLTAPTPIQKSKRRSLFNKIMNHLRKQ